MTTTTAKLSNVIIMTKDGTPVIAGGNIEQDTRHRWVDGTRIHTSNIINIDGNIITTLNSVYEVEGDMVYREYTV